MKKFKIIMVLLLTFAICNYGFAQERGSKEKTEKQEKVKEEKELKKFKKEQEEYEKEHGKVTPINKQDENPMPDVSADRKKPMDDNDDDALEVDDDNGADNEKMGKADKMKKEKSNNGKGNAYGKNKGDLTGREFGQARAADTKTKIEDYEDDFEDRKKFMMMSRERIDNAKIRLSEDKEAGKLSEEQIAKREEKIAMAEEKLAKLRTTMEMGQKRLLKQKERLRELNADQE